MRVLAELALCPAALQTSLCFPCLPFSRSDQTVFSGQGFSLTKARLQVRESLDKVRRETWVSEAGRVGAGATLAHQASAGIMSRLVIAIG